jgi:UDP-glucose 4-epimerase
MVKKKIARALVTGGAGFIGSHLCEELLKRGFAVTAMDDLSTGSKKNILGLTRDRNFKFYKGSILDYKLMRRLIKECDIVYHLAAAVGVRYILNHALGSLLTNVDGTKIVLELADEHRKKVFLASTSEVYGKHVCSPFSENDDRILGSTSVNRWSYSDAKAIDEVLALAYAKERKLRVVIARFFNTVGPRQTGRYGMVLPRFVREALSNKPITVYGDGSQIRSFAHVKDVVKAAVGLSMLKKAEGEIFNIGNDVPITIKEMAEKIKLFTRSRSKIKFISFEDAFGKKYADFEEIECRIPDISKLKKLLKYSPQSDADSIIRSIVEYFSEKGR